MPNSLKCRLKRLVHKGLLSEKDLSRLYTDNDVIEELKKLRLQIYNIEEPDHDFEGFFQCQDEAIEIISKAIDELKGENKC